MHSFSKIILAFGGLGVASCVAPSAPSAPDVVTDDTALVASAQPITMTDAQRSALVEKKATCPFVGAAVFMKKLVVWNTLETPLGRIDDVAAIGDEGGGDLGVAIAAFARGNHHRLVPTRDEVPPGMFSLDFPGSQGAHPGHSGILLQGTKSAYRGGLDESALARLTDHAVDVDGVLYIRRSDIGRFVWHDVENDPASVYLGHGLAITLFDDLAALHAHPTFEGLVKLAAADHLVATAGEFGLLMTLLEVPGLEVRGEPAARVSDIRAMFVDKKLPQDLGTRRHTLHRWLAHAMGILLAAEGARIHGGE